MKLTSRIFFAAAAIAAIATSVDAGTYYGSSSVSSVMDVVDVSSNSFLSNVMIYDEGASNDEGASIFGNGTIKGFISDSGGYVGGFSEETSIEDWNWDTSQAGELSLSVHLSDGSQMLMVWSGSELSTEYYNEYVVPILDAFFGECSNYANAFDAQSIDWSNYPLIPEPSTYALILGGLGLGFVMIRRRAAKRA